MAFTWTATKVDDDGNVAHRPKGTVRTCVYKLAPAADYETAGGSVNVAGEFSAVTYAFAGPAVGLNASTRVPWVSSYANISAIPVKITSITNVGAELANATSLGALEVYLTVRGTSAA